MTSITPTVQKYLPSPSDGDIPFILCTPTKDGSDEAVAFDFTCDEETSKPMNLFLKPKRSYECLNDCHYQKDGGIDMLTKSSLDEDSANELRECNTSHLSSMSSPVPNFVMTTPPVIRLVKRPRRAPQDEQQQEDSAAEISHRMRPLFFPILTRRGDNSQQLQLQQQQFPLRRPIARRPR